MSVDRTAETVVAAWRRMFITRLASCGVEIGRAAKVYEELMNGDWLEEWDDMTPEEAADACLELCNDA